MAKKTRTTRRKKAAPGSVGLTPDQVRNASDTQLRDLAAHVGTDGGAVLGTYCDPFGGATVLLVALPIDRSSRRRFSAIHQSRTSSD